MLAASDSPSLADMEIPCTGLGPAGATTAPSRGPDPEPLGFERFHRLTSRRARRPAASPGRTAPPPPPCDACERGAPPHLPIPDFIPGEPALISPYLTDGRRLLRIISHASLGSEMIVVLEDCETLVVELKAWQELAGGIRALPATPAREAQAHDDDASQRERTV
jgi:hypothetical protein